MENKITKNRRLILTVYLILRLFIIIAMISQIFLKNWGNVFLCILTLILYLIPDILDRKFNIELPGVLEVIILLFIYASLILGEIRYFYKTFPYWDTILHTINGFICAGIGFSLVDILNQNEKIHIKLSTVFVALVAFCFSMTMGVIWEFYEYGVDKFTNNDMQKDTIITEIKSVTLNEKGENIPENLKNIKFTKVYMYEKGELKEKVIEGGYLDVGVNDTMKDLLVNFIGAFTFSVFGYLYIKNRDKYKFTEYFIPRKRR